jgi:hypothetical protein
MNLMISIVTACVKITARSAVDIVNTITRDFYVAEDTVDFFYFDQRLPLFYGKQALCGAL